MILAIDIGNTNIVIGCCDENKIYFVERLSTNSTKTELEYAISFKNVLELYKIDPKEIDGGIISSVVPPITNIVRDSAEKVLGKAVKIVGPGVKTGLNILMDNPAQVGSDRIVNAVAAINEYATPLIIIDMGTATTFCVVDENKNYIGGMILPGVGISVDALTARTSQLSRISIESPKKLIGKNTIDCMKSGIINGNAACIDGMITRINRELGQEATVIATGGLSKKIVPYCEQKICIDDELLLKGLRLIYEKNK
ncbi:type III pantothenate kinase [Faecalimonas sp.]